MGTRASARFLRKAFATILDGLGTLLNRTVTTVPQETQGVWLFENREKADVAGPLASIAARREGINASPDAADAIAAAIAVVGYLVRHIKLRGEIRRQLAEGTLDPETGLAREAFAEPTEVHH